MATEENADLVVECPVSLLSRIGEFAEEACGPMRQAGVEFSGERFGKNLALNCRLPFRPRETELCGVLFGKREQMRVRIADFRPLISEYACERTTALAEEERQAFVDLIAGARAEKALAGLEPVGWLRAHPKSGGNLTRRDLEIFDYFFNEPWQIGLVLRPTRTSPAMGRFFFRAADGSICHAFQEITVPAAPAGALLRVERNEWANRGSLPEPNVPPSAAMRSAPGMARRPWQPPRPPMSAASISPVVWIMGAVLALGYWWISALEQPVYRTPHLRTPPVKADSDHPSDHPKDLQQESQDIWNKWQNELKKRQDAVALAEKLDQEASQTELQESPVTPAVPPAPSSAKPLAPAPVDRKAGRTPHAFVTSSASAKQGAAADVGRAKHLVQERHATPRSLMAKAAPPEAGGLEQPFAPASENYGRRSRLQPSTNSPVPAKQAPISGVGLPKNTATVTAPFERPSTRPTQATQIAKAGSLPSTTNAGATVSGGSEPGAKPTSASTESQISLPAGAAGPPQGRQLPATPSLQETRSPSPPANSRAVADAASSTSGRLIWTGRVEKDGIVVIDGNNASIGSFSGQLPGRPIRFSIYPGNLTGDGFVLYTANAQLATRPWESPGPQNGWNKTLYSLDPHRAEAITILEAPGPENGWKRLVLHAKGHGPSVIFIDWKLAR